MGRRFPSAKSAIKYVDKGVARQYEDRFWRALAEEYKREQRNRNTTTPAVSPPQQ